MEHVEQLSETAKVSIHTNKLGTFLVLVSAAAFGLMPIFTKFAYKAGLNILTVLSLRFLIASLVLWAILLLKRESLVMPKKELFTQFGLGAIGYGLMSAFYFGSVKLIPAGLASIVLYTYPVIVTLLAAWLNKEKLSRGKVLPLMISSTGLILVVGTAFQGGLNARGLFYSFMSAVIYALYIILSDRLASDTNPLVLTTNVVTSAGIAIGAVGLATGQIHLNFGVAGWVAICAIAIVSSIISILTFFVGMKIIGPAKASIISSMEPVITTLAAFIIFSEKISLLQIVGGALVITAVVLVQKE